MRRKYKEQKKVSEKDAEYGIKAYTKDQLDFHKDIMELLKSVRYQEITLSQIKKEGKIKFKAKGNEKTTNTK